ncbi:MAG: hypothetical protein Q9159_005583 [Coniocarpon cinnabarinum]
MDATQGSPKKAKAAAPQNRPDLPSVSPTSTSHEPTTRKAQAGSKRAREADNDDEDEDYVEESPPPKKQKKTADQTGRKKTGPVKGAKAEEQARKKRDKTPPGRVRLLFFPQRQRQIDQLSGDQIYSEFENAYKGRPLPLEFFFKALEVPGTSADYRQKPKALAKIRDHILTFRTGIYGTRAAQPSDQLVDYESDDTYINPREDPEVTAAEQGNRKQNERDQSAAQRKQKETTADEPEKRPASSKKRAGVPTASMSNSHATPVNPAKKILSNNAGRMNTPVTPADPMNCSFGSSSAFADTLQSLDNTLTTDFDDSMRSSATSHSIHENAALPDDDVLMFDDSFQKVTYQRPGSTESQEAASEYPQNDEYQPTGREKVRYDATANVLPRSTRGPPSTPQVGSMDDWPDRYPNSRRLPIWSKTKQPDDTDVRDFFYTPYRRFQYPEADENGETDVGQLLDDYGRRGWQLGGNVGLINAMAERNLDPVRDMDKPWKWLVRERELPNRVSENDPLGQHDAHAYAMTTSLLIYEMEAAVRRFGGDVLLQLIPVIDRLRRDLHGMDGGVPGNQDDQFHDPEVGPGYSAAMPHWQNQRIQAAMADREYGLNQVDDTPDDDADQWRYDTVDVVEEHDRMLDPEVHCRHCGDCHHTQCPGRSRKYAPESSRGYGAHVKRPADDTDDIDAEGDEEVDGHYLASKANDAGNPTTQQTPASVRPTTAGKGLPEGFDVQYSSDENESQKPAPPKKVKKTAKARKRNSPMNANEAADPRVSVTNDAPSQQPRTDDDPIWIDSGRVQDPEKRLPDASEECRADHSAWRPDHSTADEEAETQLSRGELLRREALEDPEWRMRWTSRPGAAAHFEVVEDAAEDQGDTGGDDHHIDESQSGSGSESGGVSEGYCEYRDGEDLGSAGEYVEDDDEEL